MKKEDFNDDLDDDLDQYGDEFFEKLRQEYDNVEVPKEMFDTSKLDPSMIRKSKIRVASIAALYVIVFISVGTLIGFMLKGSITAGKPNEKDNVQAEQPINDEKEIHIKTNALSYGNLEYKFVNLIKLDEIMETTFINDVPYTKVKVSVQENYLGDLKEEYIYVPGGRFKVDDVKDKLENYNVTNLEDLNEYNNVYLNYNTGMSISRPVVGEEYLVSLEEKDGKLFASLNLKYGFKKFDKESNCIITDEGEKIPVNMEEYLKNK